jgi:hypothetical protein
MHCYVQVIFYISKLYVVSDEYLWFHRPSLRITVSAVVFCVTSPHSYSLLFCSVIFFIYSCHLIFDLQVGCLSHCSFRRILVTIPFMNITCSRVKTSSIDLFLQMGCPMTNPSFFFITQWCTHCICIHLFIWFILFFFDILVSVVAHKGILLSSVHNTV